MCFAAHKVRARIRHFGHLTEHLFEAMIWVMESIHKNHGPQKHACRSGRSSSPTWRFFLRRFMFFCNGFLIVGKHVIEHEKQEKWQCNAGKQSALTLSRAFEDCLSSDSKVPNLSRRHACTGNARIRFAVNQLEGICGKPIYNVYCIFIYIYTVSRSLLVGTAVANDSTTRTTRSTTCDGHTWYL